MFWNYSNLLFYSLIFKKYNTLQTRDITGDEAQKIFDAYLIINVVANDKIKVENFDVKSASDENKMETCMYLEAKINEIETFEDNEDYWDAKEINNYNDFYCYQLCSKKEYCDAFKIYNEKKEYINKIQEQEKIDKECEDLAKFI